MEQVMPDFITYLTNERNASKSTVSSYCRDLERMFQFLDGKGIKKTDDVTPISLNSYILYLENAVSRCAGVPPRRAEWMRRRTR